jgi:hypothetical protein
MQSAIDDDPGKGIVRPSLDGGDWLAVGVGEQDQAFPRAVALELTNDAHTLAGGDGTVGSELPDQGHVGRGIRDAPDVGSDGEQPVGDDG